jgi:SAM-dependent methyltransferase
LEDGSTIVEVGSWKGKSISYFVVESLNRGKTFNVNSVDTWVGAPEHQEHEVVKNDQLFELFLDNISPIKEHLNVIRKPSTEAAKTFEDGSLDFVFIDACHEYQDVKDDIESWIDKIKPGGVIAGHDYLHPDVKQAVDEFFGDCVIFRNPMENCWIINVE